MPGLAVLDHVRAAPGILVELGEPECDAVQHRFGNRPPAHHFVEHAVVGQAQH